MAGGVAEGSGAAENTSNETEIKLRADLDLWVEWARKKADWVDPVAQGEDEMLGRYGVL